jgi:2-dehydropantoate 2-reductase
VISVHAPADVVPDPDLVILAVKAFSVPDALRSLPPWPGTQLLTVQNGVGSEEVALTARPAAALVAASLTSAVALDDDGVRWLRRGGLGLATVAGSTEGTIERLDRAFSSAGLPVRRYPDWRAMKWSKLLANIAGNAVSALVDRSPGEVYRDPVLFALEREQVREAVAVMRRLGLRPVGLPGAWVPGLVLGMRVHPSLGRRVLSRVLAGARGGKAPSLRAHVARDGGPSEVGWLNGAVAREGERLGLRTPVNAALARLVESAATDPAVRDALRDRPDRLVVAVRDGGIVASAAGAAGAGTQSG